MRVGVLGASPHPERYSNQAIRELKAHGHEVLPINPAHRMIESLPVIHRLSAVEGPLDTLTVYVGPRHILPLIPEIVAARPRRVILNPGAESPELKKALADAGIPCLEACTLVLLRTDQFGR